ncbi:MAG: devR [Nitrospira sp.]|nr:devR [Nitrospira sp.]
MQRPEGKPIRLLLVDDHEVLRIGLRTLFAETGEFDVVGEAGTVAGAVTEAQRLKPDVVLERGQWGTARQRGENRRRRAIDPGPGRGPAGADPGACDDGRSRRREE